MTATSCRHFEIQKRFDRDEEILSGILSPRWKFLRKTSHNLRIQQCLTRSPIKKKGGGGEGRETEETSRSGGCSFSRGSNTKDLSAGQPNSLGIWPLKRSVIQRRGILVVANFNPLTPFRLDRCCSLPTKFLNIVYNVYIHVSSK